VVFFVLESHGALHFSRGVDKLAQRIKRQRVIVAAGRDELEFAGLMVGALGILAGEEEALDLSGCIQRVVVLLVLLIGIRLKHAAQIAGVGGAVLVDHVAKNQNLAVAENVGRHPVEGAPVDSKAQIALFLGCKAPNRGAVKGQILVGTQQELLVIIEQVQAAFEVSKENGYSLDPLFVGQILQPLLANLMSRNAIGAVGFGLQIKLFQFVIRESKKITILVRHWSPLQW